MSQSVIIIMAALALMAGITTSASDGAEPKAPDQEQQIVDSIPESYPEQVITPTKSRSADELNGK